MRLPLFVLLLLLLPLPASAANWSDLASINSESAFAVCALDSAANYLNCGSTNPIIDGSGNLGIGTTTAHHLIDIFGNAGIKASGYLNFGTTDGSSGYGIRDNGGTIECKNSSGSWSACQGGSASAAGSTGYVQFNGGGTLAADSNFFWDNTDKYLGIGTTVPATALDVFGDISLYGQNGLSYPTTDSTPGASIAIGVGALAYENSLAPTAFYNTAIGYQAMNAAGLGTAAVENTAVGVFALASDTTGDSNTATGYTAAASNTTGTGNSAFGHGSLLSNDTGYDNTAIGYGALGSNVSGYRNVALGEQALNASTGNFNTAVGWRSLAGGSGMSGSFNTSLGVGAGYVITSGSFNTILGYDVANAKLTTGSNNILIGTDQTTDTPAVDTSNFLNIGNIIYATNLQNSSNTGGVATVGIGTAAPVTNVDVNGSIRVSDGGQTCDDAHLGMFRYNAATKKLQICHEQ